MIITIVVLCRPSSNYYYYMPSLKQLLFYVVPQSSDEQSLILGVLPPGLSIIYAVGDVCQGRRGMSAVYFYRAFCIFGHISSSCRRHQNVSLEWNLMVVVCVPVVCALCVNRVGQGL